MLQYVADAVIASAKGRGRIPDSAFGAGDLLQIANEELESYIVPLLTSVQEDYYETDADYPLSSALSTTYRLPSRAVGGGLREVSFLDASGATIDVPRIDVTDLEAATWGFVLKSQSVQYVNRVSYSGSTTLRMTYSFSPNLLCQAANAAVVTYINGAIITLGAVGTPTSPLPAPSDGGAPSNMAGVTSFDFIKATPGFECIAFDQTGTCNGTTLTLDGSVPTSLAVGDYVAQAHYTPVPQCPTAFVPLLSQSIAAQLLKRMGSLEESQAALAERKLMETQVLPLVQNRIRGAPKSLIARRGILQCGRRW